MKKSVLFAAASIASLMLALPLTTEAAELKVLAGGSMTATLNELGPQFEDASGHKITIHFDSTPNLIKLASLRSQ
jgi:molybdate transport system substrate-binding protein